MTAVLSSDIQTFQISHPTIYVTRSLSITGVGFNFVFN